MLQSDCHLVRFQLYAGYETNINPFYFSIFSCYQSMIKLISVHPSCGLSVTKREGIKQYLTVED
jgi:hypothetical protein